LIYQKWYISISGSELRKIPVLLAAILVLLMIPAPSAFPTSTNNSAYPATALQVPVSPDTYPANILQPCLQSHGIINCHPTSPQHATGNPLTNLNAANQATPSVNAYGSPTTQTYLAVFDKAFNVPAHAPPSSKVPCSIGCPTINSNSTLLGISFDSANKGGILVYCSALSNPACYVVTGTSATATQWAAMIALANQHNTGQGHNPLQLDSALHPLPERTTHNNNLDITLGNSELSSRALQFNAATGFDVLSTWRTPSIQSLAPVPLNITYP
jgi:hypothetical protein